MTLFDTIDKMLTSLYNGPLSKKPWSRTFGDGVKVMSTKLKKYYDTTSHPYVYSDAVILNPKIKTELFEWETFKRDNWKQIYLDGIKKRYKEYELMYPEATTSSVPRKRLAVEIDSDSNSDSYSKLIKDLEQEENLTSEIERYLTTPRNSKLEPLEWWKVNQTAYP